MPLFLELSLSAAAI